MRLAIEVDLPSQPQTIPMKPDGTNTTTATMSPTNNNSPSVRNRAQMFEEGLQHHGRGSGRAGSPSSPTRDSRSARMTALSRKGLSSTGGGPATAGAGGGLMSSNRRYYDMKSRRIISPTGRAKAAASPVGFGGFSSSPKRESRLDEEEVEEEGARASKTLRERLSPTNNCRVQQSSFSSSIMRKKRDHLPSWNETIHEPPEENRPTSLLRRTHESHYGEETAAAEAASSQPAKKKANSSFGTLYNNSKPNHNDFSKSTAEEGTGTGATGGGRIRRLAAASAVGGGGAGGAGRGGTSAVVAAWAGGKQQQRPKVASPTDLERTIGLEEGPGWFSPEDSTSASSSEWGTKYSGSALTASGKHRRQHPGPKTTSPTVWSRAPSPLLANGNNNPRSPSPLLGSDNSFSNNNTNNARLRALRSRSPRFAAGYSGDYSLRKNLDAASTVMQEEKKDIPSSSGSNNSIGGGSRGSSSSSSSSSRSSLHIEELKSVAEKAVQLSKTCRTTAATESTRTNLIRSSPLRQMMMEKRPRKVHVNGPASTAPPAATTSSSSTATTSAPTASRTTSSDSSASPFGHHDPFQQTTMPLSQQPPKQTKVAKTTMNRFPAETSSNPRGDSPFSNPFQQVTAPTASLTSGEASSFNNSSSHNNGVSQSPSPSSPSPLSPSHHHQQPLLLSKRLSRAERFAAIKRSAEKYEEEHGDEEKTPPNSPKKKKVVHPVFGYSKTAMTSHQQAPTTGGAGTRTTSHNNIETGDKDDSSTITSEGDNEPTTTTTPKSAITTRSGRLATISAYKNYSNKRFGNSTTQPVLESQQVNKQVDPFGAVSSNFRKNIDSSKHDDQQKQQQPATSTRQFHVSLGSPRNNHKLLQSNLGRDFQGTNHQLSRGGKLGGGGSETTPTSPRRFPNHQPEDARDEDYDVALSRNREQLLQARLGGNNFRHRELLPSANALVSPRMLRGGQGEDDIHSDNAILSPRYPTTGRIQPPGRSLRNTGRYGIEDEKDVGLKTSSPSTSSSSSSSSDDSSEESESLHLESFNDFNADFPTGPSNSKTSSSSESTGVEETYYTNSTVLEQSTALQGEEVLSSLFEGVNSSIRRDPNKNHNIDEAEYRHERQEMPRSKGNARHHGGIGAEQTKVPQATSQITQQHDEAIQWWMNKYATKTNNMQEPPGSKKNANSSPSNKRLPVQYGARANKRIDDDEEDIFSGLEELVIEDRVQSPKRKRGLNANRSQHHQPSQEPAAPSPPPAKVKSPRKSRVNRPSILRNPKSKNNHEGMVLDEEKILDVKSDITSSLVSGVNGPQGRRWFQKRGVHTIHEEGDNAKRAYDNYYMETEDNRRIMSCSRDSNEEDILDNSAVVNSMSLSKLTSNNANEQQCQSSHQVAADTSGALISLGFSLVDTISSVCRMPSKFTTSKCLRLMSGGTS